MEAANAMYGLAEGAAEKNSRSLGLREFTSDCSVSFALLPAEPEIGI